MRSADKLKMDFDHYVRSLDQAPVDEGVVAFFDLDRTLISGYSITALALESVFSGGLSPRGFLTHARIFLGYGIGRSNYHDLLESTAQELAGLPEEEMIKLGQRAFKRRLQASIYDEARCLVAAHRSKGHRVVMVTSATRYQAQPIALELGIPHMCCTELEIEDGRITGNAYPCYGEGKKQAATRFAASRQHDLDNAYFYTDSQEDLPLLEAVGCPVVANAKPAFSKVASSRGWTQLSFAGLRESSSPIAA